MEISGEKRLRPVNVTVTGVTAKKIIRLAAEKFFIQNEEDIAHGRTSGRSGRDLGQLLLKNDLIKNFKMRNEDFFDKGVATLEQPAVTPEVQQIVSGFAMQDIFLRNCLKKFRSTSFSTNDQNQPQKSLTVLFQQPEQVCLERKETELEALALLITLAKCLPKQDLRFDLPDLTAENLIDIRVKSTALGPMNLITSDTTLMNQLLTARKTDFTVIQSALAEYDIKRIKEGGFPVTRPMRPCPKNEVIKNAKPLRLIYVGSVNSYRMASLYFTPMEKSLVGSIRSGSFLGISLDNDIGMQVLNFWTPYGKDPIVLVGDKTNNEGHETCSAAICVLALIARFYKNWTGFHKRAVSGFFTEYILPTLLVGGTLISTPRTGVVPSGHALTRFGNGVRNFYDYYQTILIAESSGKFSRDLFIRMIESGKYMIEGGDDKLIPLNIKDSSEKKLILGTFNSISNDLKRPYGELEICPLVSKNIDSNGVVTGGAEFMKHRFVREEMNDRIYYTRSAERVYPKLFLFKNSMTLECLLSNLLKCMEQVPANPVLFHKLNQYKLDIQSELELGKIPITSKFLENYIEKSIRSEGMLDLNMSYSDVIDLQSGTYSRNAFVKINDMCYDSSGMSIYPYQKINRKKMKPIDPIALKDKIIFCYEKLSETFGKQNALTLMQNTTVYQGSVTLTSLRTSLYKGEEMPFTGRSIYSPSPTKTILDKRNIFLKCRDRQFSPTPPPTIVDLQLAINYLGHSRIYRSKNKAMDATSKLSIVGNPSHISTHAKFFFALEALFRIKSIDHELFLKKTQGKLIVLHIGSGSIGSKSTYGIIEFLQPQKIFCVDPMETECILKIGNTLKISFGMSYNKFKLTDTFKSLLQLKKTDFLLIVSDASIANEDGVEVSTLKTNAVNKAIHEDFIGTLGIFKHFIVPYHELRTAFTPVSIPYKPVYKHLAHNLEYFTNFEPSCKSDNDWAAFLIYYGNEIRNDFTKNQNVPRDRIGKIFTVPEISKVTFNQVPRLYHPRTFTSDYGAYGTPMLKVVDDHEDDITCLISAFMHLRHTEGHVFKINKPPNSEQLEEWESTTLASNTSELNGKIKKGNWTSGNASLFEVDIITDPGFGPIKPKCTKDGIVNIQMYASCLNFIKLHDLPFSIIGNNNDMVVHPYSLA